MKTKNRVISGLIISAILASGLFAVNGEIDRKDEKRKGEPSCMMEKEKFHKGERGQRGESHIFGIFKELNLTSEQQTKIEQIVADVRKNEITPDVAFTKDSFDKNKFISMMNDRRDNMIKSQAEIMEKSYAILTAKQKEQLKVLMDLRKERMENNKAFSKAL